MLSKGASQGAFFFAMMYETLVRMDEQLYPDLESLYQEVRVA